MTSSDSKMTLAEAAARALSGPAPKASLERIWHEAALRTLATDETVDPDPAALKPLTIPAVTWRGARDMGAEGLWDRIARLRDCHHLAIVHADREWLASLDECWACAPDLIEPFWPLRARGEIALGRASFPTVEPVWNPDEIQMLMEEGFLSLKAPVDRVWLALSAADLDAARSALAEHEARLSEAREAWEHDPLDGLRQALTYPGTVLRTELRALARLVREATSLV